MSDLAKILGPLYRKISNLVTRGAVGRADSTGKMQRLQLRLLAGETKDDVEHFEPFGFTSKPLAGAEHVTIFMDGDRSHGITLVVADRRYRLQGLADGEAALHDAFGNKAHFKADGTLDVVAGAKVQITSPLVTMSGNLEVTGNISAGGNVAAAAAVTAGTTVTAPNIVGTTNVTFAGKSGIAHTHNENNVLGGPTGGPN